jgi:hypothetical protein
LAGGVLLLAALPVLAHHSVSAEFDATKRFTVTGKVTKVEWANPHIWFYVAVDESGKTVQYQFEGGPPNTLRRQGWTSNSMKEGDVVTVQAMRAKDGTNTGNAGSVTLANGKKLFAGSNEDNAK